ncbi:MAG TPA: siderophore biosynthesis protein SbnG [Dehalococcoidia bacterium]|jgi:2-keto-3-deoxy-L-rhamnonate aldolase RhmA|nr:siderophore biosynthesis protein SbnG [Dehalococcoidia bacterium]HIK88757.1 siderophore biosynthesis protein SbnG [Dehalococcoidia bacterium]
MASFGTSRAYRRIILRSSNIRKAINNGTISHNLTVTFPEPTIAEWAGYAGFDGLHLDMEHGVFDWESVEMMCRVADMHGMTCSARIPNTETDTILRAFDRGLMGILCPHVDNAEQAQRIAMAARFGPEGARSFGTSRGRDYGMHDMTPAEYMAEFNREVTVAIQIETKNAAETIEEILDVEGIDLITFGAQDLAQSYGHPGHPEHPEVVEAMASVVTAVHARGRLMSSDVERGINLVQWLPEKLKDWLAESRSK